MKDLINIKDYLKERGVPFAVKFDCETGGVSIIGVKITKDGKFYRANGKIIAGNMAKLFL